MSKEKSNILTLIDTGEGADSTPHIFIIMLIMRSQNSLTFLIYIVYTKKQKNFNFLLWVPISGTLQNVEIYLKKIDQQIFASETIFLL